MQASLQVKHENTSKLSNTCTLLHINSFPMSVAAIATGTAFTSTVPTTR